MKRTLIWVGILCCPVYVAIINLCDLLEITHHEYTYVYPLIVMTPLSFVCLIKHALMERKPQ